MNLSIPVEVAGWQGTGDWEVFDTDTIYGYIDGHAEVYMAYGMVRCLSRRYSGPEGEPEIVLDLFEQASAADAFGVFTHDRDGEEVDIGQGGLFRHGWLSFWKGHWFGSVYAEGESEASKEAVLALGRAAAEAIAEMGEVPPLVGVWNDARPLNEQASISIVSKLASLQSNAPAVPVFTTTTLSITKDPVVLACATRR